MLDSDLLEDSNSAEQVVKMYGVNIAAISPRRNRYEPNFVVVAHVSGESRLELNKHDNDAWLLCGIFAGLYSK
jgi:hypothetical protein